MFACALPPEFRWSEIVYQRGRVLAFRAYCLAHILLISGDFENLGWKGQSVGFCTQFVARKS